jgi:adenosylcobinamide-phosphate synthase
MIWRTETILRRFAKNPRTLRIAGIILALVIVSAVYFTSQLLLSSLFKLSSFVGYAISVFLAYTTLATRELGKAAKAVLRQLDTGDIERARIELSMIVGRDTAQLDEKELVRAVVETVAENASDGVVAPLFYLALGGPALALAYKAVNTLDSMVGYKNDKYINFGWAAARLDDAANYLPARITAVLICLVADIHRGLTSVINARPATAPSPQSSPSRGEGDSALRIPFMPAHTSALLECRVYSAFQSPWRVMFRDGKNHPSPNSGYPEAAMAGALGIRLGGPSAYSGIQSHKPFIGDAQAPLDKNYIEKSIRLMYGASLFAVLLATMAGYYSRPFFA